jgi:hypothetical protein
MLRKLKLTNVTDLQFGFTEGLNPIMASLLISEAKTLQNVKAFT